MLTLTKVKIRFILTLSLLLISNTLHAQDSIKTSAKNKVNWLINMARLNNAEDIIDSIQIRGYKLVSKNETTTGTTLMYRIKAHEEYCGLIIENDDKVNPRHAVRSL